MTSFFSSQPNQNTPIIIAPHSKGVSGTGNVSILRNIDNISKKDYYNLSKGLISRIESLMDSIDKLSQSHYRNYYQELYKLKNSLENTKYADLKSKNTEIIKEKIRRIYKIEREIILKEDSVAKLSTESNRIEDNYETNISNSLNKTAQEKLKIKSQNDLLIPGQHCISNKNYETNESCILHNYGELVNDCDYPITVICSVPATDMKSVHSIQIIGTAINDPVKGKILWYQNGFQGSCEENISYPSDLDNKYNIRLPVCINKKSPVSGHTFSIKIALPKSSSISWYRIKYD